MRRASALAVLGTLLLLAGCSAQAPDGTGSTAPAPAPSKPRPAAPKGVLDGMYLVGTDIPAGTYRTQGVVPGSSAGLCIWERAKDDSGSFDSFLDSRSGTGPDRVTLRPGEYFRTDGCKPWTRQ